MIGMMEGDGAVEGAMLIAFDSTQQALRAEMLLEYADIEIDLFLHQKRLQQAVHYRFNSHLMR